MRSVESVLIAGRESMGERFVEEIAYSEREPEFTFANNIRHEIWVKEVPIKRRQERNAEDVTKLHTVDKMV